jgi:NAD(P)-dependent dehydrogenase (short-subunit alcohol dehydrogenase family)
MNPFTLEGKNILITGASSGIGRQCAISCAQMGAKVVLVGRRKEKLTETIRMVESPGKLFYSLDITNYKEIEGMIDDAVGKTGPINGFIHSAGIELILPLSVTKPAHYQELFATNVIAGFEFARILSKKKYAPHEGGSKGEIIAGVKALALELAEKKIRVNCVSPAQIEGTEMTMKMRESLNDQNKKDIFSMHPLGYGNTDDVANGCIYLLSDASKWVTGTNLIIDGGYSAK